MTIFTMPVFDATVIVDGNELFKGKGAAEGWAKKLAVENKCAVTAHKIGNGWALSGSIDGTAYIWGIYGQRLKRLE